jgi:Sec-independent protein translocase protein TatA
MVVALIFDSVGLGEWIVLLAVLLLVVGPRRLPATVRRAGRLYAKVRRAADAFLRQVMEADAHPGGDRGPRADS